MSCPIALRKARWCAGPFLNRLRLTVDLSEVILDVNGVTGAGNLLGNLLCAVTGLLDLPGALAAITQLLGSINNILSGLTTSGVGGVMWIVPPRAGTCRASETPGKTSMG